MCNYSLAYIKGLYAVESMYDADEFYVEEVNNCSDWNKDYAEGSQECIDFKQGFHDAIFTDFDAYAYAKEKGYGPKIWQALVDAEKSEPERSRDEKHE